MNRARSLVAASTGFLFAIGLALSGMTRPSKVLGFLDVAGEWDPSLGLVMVSALAVSFVLFRLVLARSRPLFDRTFHLPGKKSVDAPLVVGAAIFGVGWGLAGYCPGPALTTLASSSRSGLAFVGSMLIGMMLFALLKRVRAHRRVRRTVGQDAPIHVGDDRRLISARRA